MAVTSDKVVIFCKRNETLYIITRNKAKGNSHPKINNNKNKKKQVLLKYPIQKNSRGKFYTSRRSRHMASYNLLPVIGLGIVVI